MKSLLDAYQNAWRQKEEANAFLAGSRQWETLRVLPRGQKLLDLGCGDGRFLAAAKTLFEETIGVEGSEEAAARAERAGVRAVVADITDTPLPFPSGHFDCVTCLDVIEHVPDPRPLLSEAARLLRPGGTFLLTTPNIRYLKRIASLLFAGRFPKTSKDPEPYDGGHFHFFTFKDIVSLLNAAGLTTVQRRGIIPSRFLSVLRPASSLWAVWEFLSDGILM